MEAFQKVGATRNKVFVALRNWKGGNGPGRRRRGGALGKRGQHRGEILSRARKGPGGRTGYHIRRGKAEMGLQSRRRWRKLE